MIAGMARLHRLAAASVACALWSQTSIHVQPPSRTKRSSGGDSHLSGSPHLPAGIVKIKEHCRLRLLARTDELFEDGRADFAPSAQRVLSELGPLLRKQEAHPHPIEIDGHTDGLGDAARKQHLSEERARAVEAWLVAHDFLTANSALVRGYGRTRPVAPELHADGSDDPAGREKNRRVEVVVDTCR